MKKVRFGKIHADHVTFDEALERIGSLVNTGTGGYVVTPNVDHVCLAEESDVLVNAYRQASLSVVDGMPLLWLSRVLGHALPEKISGSDLIGPLMVKAAKEGWRVYILGGKPGVGLRAAAILESTHPGLEVSGVDAPPLGFENNPQQLAEALAKIRRAQPHLLLVALGCPKQELWMQQNQQEFAPAIALGIGATVDFIAGEVRRCPAWMSRCGIEWVYRLLQEPRRMAARYLVRDRAIARIAWRMWRTPHQERILLTH